VATTGYSGAVTTCGSLERDAEIAEARDFNSKMAFAVTYLELG